MKEVKIKVKTLLVIFLVIMVFGSSIYFLRDNILYGLGLAFDTFGSEDMANAYYNRVTDKFYDRESSIKAANKQIEKIVKDRDFNYLWDNVVIVEGMTKSGANIDYNSLVDINADFEKIYKNNDKNETLGRYSIGVSIMNWFGGEYKRAIDILEGIDYLEGDLEEVRKLNLSSMYMNIGEIEKGREILDKDIDKGDNFRYVRKDLLNYSYFMMGKYEDLSWHESDYSIRYKVHERIDEAYIKPILGLNDLIRELDELSQLAESNINSGNEISGRVTLDDKPLAYAIVFAKDREYRGMSSGFLDMGVRAFGISDNDGNFTIKNIPDGRYGLGISVDWQRIKNKQIAMDREYNMVFHGNDKITKNIEFFNLLKVISKEKLDENNIKFIWENNRSEVEYYRVGIALNKEGSFSTIYHTDKIYDKSYILNIEDMRNSNNVGRGLSYGMDGIDPYSILDPLAYGGEYVYTITGYDSNDNVVISNKGIFNNGDYDTVFLEGRELSLGDKLLIDRKYEEAIIEYEKSFKDNPLDLEAARSLALLYTYGWEYDNRDNRGELLGSDYNKAKEYYEILEEKDKLSNILLYQYARVLIRLEEYDKAIKLYEKLLDRGEEYHYSSLGKMYVYKKDYSVAVEYYNKFLESSKYNYVVDELIMIYALENKTDLLIDVSKKYDYTNYHDSYEEVIKDYINIDKSDYDKFYDLIKSSNFTEAEKFLEGKDDDLSKLYKGILILQKPLERFEREVEYTKIYKSVKDPLIKKLMEYLGKDNISSAFGNTRF